MKADITVEEHDIPKTEITLKFESIKEVSALIAISNLDDYVAGLISSTLFCKKNEVSKQDVKDVLAFIGDMAFITKRKITGKYEEV